MTNKTNEIESIKDRKDTAWFETQVIDNDSLNIYQKFKLYWDYVWTEVKELKEKQNESK